MTEQQKPAPFWFRNFYVIGEQIEENTDAHVQIRLESIYDDSCEVTIEALIEKDGFHLVWESITTETVSQALDVIRCFDIQAAGNFLQRQLSKLARERISEEASQIHKKIYDTNDD